MIVPGQIGDDHVQNVLPDGLAEGWIKGEEGRDLNTVSVHASAFGAVVSANSR